MPAVEEFRRSSGLEAITARCFKASGISTVLIDDGFELDKKHDINWHQKFVPSVGRILRIERLAEKILDEVGLGVFKSSSNSVYIVHFSENGDDLVYLMLIML